MFTKSNTGIYNGGIETAQNWYFSKNQQKSPIKRQYKSHQANKPHHMLFKVNITITPYLIKL